MLAIAPKAEIYAYKVCEKTVCNGVAQIKALETAMDPNGDDDTSDRVSTINMSIGRDFGDIEGSAVQTMITAMTKLGINIVVSAGNDGPVPFIVGGPSTNNSALSVGAMTHPSAPVSNITATMANQPMEVIAAEFNQSNQFEFNQTTTALVHPAQNALGCAVYSPDTDFTGKAVLLDRGTCSYTDKVLNAQKLGAKLVIIANKQANQGPQSMTGSSNNISIPAIAISKEDGAQLKQQISNNQLTYSITAKEVLNAGAITSFTSRGPSIAGTLKPEITAPGSKILTAEPGTGNALTPVSGTSFSAPIVTGAVALIKELYPDRNAFEVKAMLMNSANLNVTTKATTVDINAPLAPISYIGAGLIDVKKASQLNVIAWTKKTKQAALAYGLVTLSEPSSYEKIIRVKNFSNSEQTFQLNVAPRYQNDEDTQAISFKLPSSITIAANSTLEFAATLHIDPSKLPKWQLSSSDLLTTSPELASRRLTLLEYDGAIEFKQNNDTILHMVYHILPKAVASVDVGISKDNSTLAYQLTNSSTINISEPILAPLTASSPIDKERRHDLINVAAEIETDNNCGDIGLRLATTFQMRDPILHPFVASYHTDLDLDNDGNWDYSISTVNYNWYDSNNPNTLSGLVHQYNATPSGKLTPAYHVTGNDFITTSACLSDLPLDKTAVDTEINVRYRVEESDFAFEATKGADTITTKLRLTPNQSLVNLTDEQGNQVTSLAPGETAQIDRNNGQLHNFIMLSKDGALSLTANFDAEDNVAPTITSTTINLEKGTDAGTVIGQLNMHDPDYVASPIAKLNILQSNPLIVIEQSGQIKLANNAVIDQQTENMQLKVSATDYYDKESDIATITINIINTAPVIKVTSPAGISGQQIVVKATGSDADFDALSYQWQQIKGTPVTFKTNESGDEISFIAPTVSSNDALAFSVFASDGKLTSRTRTSIIQISPATTPPEEESSGGALGWLALLLSVISIHRYRQTRLI